MLFNSFQFIIFFIIVFTFYWILKHKYRWILLLVASYYFYMCWRAEYALLLFFGTFTSYVCGLLIERSKKKSPEKSRGGRLYVWLNAIICFSLLIYFKYLNFICQSINGIFDIFSFLPQIDIPVFDIVLPVGISFHIFQNVGYTTDVYRDRVSVEKHFGYYALFASYFPQLVAGPIERTENLMPQLHKEHKFNYDQATDGVRLMLFGMFKKVAVADTLAVFVDNVYNSLETFCGLALIAATVLFAFQIYCDFSGYSDIARGCSKLLGIELMLNFQSPYFANSISEFWRKWHISLSTWFRDNVYIPLGGNRVGIMRNMFNLMVTFILSGIWHGAGWTFIIWGALHGFYLCCSTFYKKVIKAKFNIKIVMPGILKNVMTFILVCFAWVFFRADSLNGAIYVLKNMFSSLSFSIVYLKQTAWGMGFTRFSFILCAALLVILIIIDYFNYKKPAETTLGQRNFFLRWGVYVMLGFVIIFCIMFTSQSQNFIYFQF